MCSHDSGSFDLWVNSINVNTLLEFSDDESACVFISIISCTADVTGVVVNFHGGARCVQCCLHADTICEEFQNFISCVCAGDDDEDLRACSCVCVCVLQFYLSAVCQ